MIRMAPGHCRSRVGFKGYFTNTFWLVLEKALRMALGVTMGVWVARYLGPEDFGELNFALSIVALVGAFTSLGLDGVLVRELINTPVRKQRLLGTAFALKSGAAALALLIVFLFRKALGSDSSPLILIIAFLPLFNSLGVIDSFFRSRVQSRFIVWSNMAATSMAALVKVGLILAKAHLVAFALVVCLETLLMVLGYLWFYCRNQGSFLLWRFEYKIAKKMLQEGWLLMFSGIFITVYMKIDQVMIKWFMGHEAVGQYAAAVRITEAWNALPILVVSSLFPAVIHAQKSSKALYAARLQQLYDIIVWITFVFALFLTLWAGPVMTFLYGPEYTPAGMVLMVHVWSTVFISLHYISGQWLVIEHLSRYALIRNFLGAFLNVILNLCLIRSYGIIGAAVATLVSLALAGFFIDPFIRPMKEAFYFKLNALLFRSLFKKV